MRNIIIDCDPGHDDAVAILLALANKDKLNIKAITTVSGNQTLDKITKNALSILTIVKEKIAVAGGAEEPLKRKRITGGEFHGESGIDGPVMPEPAFEAEEENAVQVMYRLLSECDGKMTIVSIAPMTNIALLLKTFPEVKSKIEMISVMGGAVHGGNATPCAEFNIYADPDAADIVFSSGIPIVMSGLDVTCKAQIMADEIEKVRNNGIVSDFFAEMMDFYIIGSRHFGFEGCPMHDSCAVAYLIKPEIFKAKEALVSIETRGEHTCGMTVADFRSKNTNAKVLMDVDRQAFAELIMEALERLDIKLN